MAASAPGSLALTVLVTLLVDVFAASAVYVELVRPVASVELVALAVLVALAGFVASAVFEAMATFAASAVFVDTLGFSHGAQKYFRDASKGANADPV